MVPATPPSTLPRLFQTEWCPASHRVRQRLTELDVTYVASQVPVEREQREALLVATGSRSIPALIAEDGAVIIGEDNIFAYLESSYYAPVGGFAHRLKAEKMRAQQEEQAAPRSMRNNCSRSSATPSPQPSPGMSRPRPLAPEFSRLHRPNETENLK
jgi:glutathione S-transferase